MKAAFIVAVVAGCKLVGGTTQWPSSSGGGAGGSSGGSSSTGEAASSKSGTFVSTKETAAKLNGLPGRPCAEENRTGFEGKPCWDPPGRDTAVPMAHAQPGMRVMQALDWKLYNPRAIYWFDMPREAKLGTDGVVELPDLGGAVAFYGPYAAEGFKRPALPAMVGRPIAEVIEAFDKLDMPFSLFVSYTEHCAGANDTVCEIANTVVDETTSHFELRVAMRIRHRGLPTEERQRPAEEKLVNRPPDEVVAELKAIGFTNVVVVEKDIPCKRGIVCNVPGRGLWHETNGAIELWVRHAKK
ncbi:MAG: hypothetical protein ACKV2T_13455 [Kofleriaceae bacterium]